MANQSGRGDAEHGTYFQLYSGAVNLFGELSPFSVRPAQRGAAWAAAGVLTTEARRPVQVVLPTGSGKTLVLCVLPYLLGSRRVIVVAPSRVVRDQIAEAFQTVGQLIRVGALPGGVSGPRVHVVEHRIASPTEWTELARSDVIVGTPGVLSPSHPGVAACPPGLVDLILVDEAHHVPATTWTSFLAQFPDVRRALFTATPFRRDRHQLPGQIVYEYSLRAALRDGVIAPVRYRPVAVTPGAQADTTLATAARERLMSDVHQAAGSAILVRTDRIEEARRLRGVYQGVGLDLPVIHSDQSINTIRKVLLQLQRREVAGVISVGVLGEGFDLPRLKIAVYHARHRSLPATLQFVGRLSRQVEGMAVQGELLAIRDSLDITDETRELYEQDSDWLTVLPDLAEAATSREKEKREFLAHLSDPSPTEFSWAAVEMGLQVYVYRLPAKDIIGQVLASGYALAVLYDATSDDQSLRAFITGRRVAPPWIRGNALDHMEYKLNVLVVDADHDLLFVSTASEAEAMALLNALGAQHAQLVSPEWLGQLINAASPDSYYSVGMRATRPPGGFQAAYKSVAGSSVGPAVTDTDGRSYALGHMIGRAVSTTTAQGSFGLSVARAKVFSTSRADLLAFRDWCWELGTLASRGSYASGTIPQLPLMMPQSFVSYPQTPVAAVLPPEAFTDDTIVIADGKRTPLVRLELGVRRMAAASCRLTLRDESGRWWRGYVTPSGEVLSTEETVRVHAGGASWSMDTFLKMHPPTIYFADGSSTTGSHYRVLAPYSVSLAAVNVEARTWAGVDIRREAKAARPPFTANVQEATVAHCLNSDPASTIICDDGPGEIADLIWLRPTAVGGLSVDLIHAKYSHEDLPGNRVVDLYEVVGQADRSVRWLHSGQFWKELKDRLETRTATRVIHSTVSDVPVWLETLVASPPQTTWTIHIVQPGLLLSGMRSWTAGTTLLLRCHEWVTQNGAIFRVVGA